MGVLSWLRGETSAGEVTSPAGTPAVSRSAPAPTPPRTGSTRFATWTEPAVPRAVEDWERRLNAYAAKCARLLAERGVPRWRCADARNGSDVYRDAFWVVSVDVDRAERFYLQNDLFRHPGAVVKQGDFGGRMQGDALLLTAAGNLFSSRTELFFPRSGNHGEGNLDSLFYSPSRELLRDSPWAGLNTGRWRRLPDSKVYGAVAHSMRSEFQGRYPPGVWTDPEPGKGSSIALSKFLSSGRTQWPRNFDEFYGR